jgi:hypothetical protein
MMMMMMTMTMMMMMIIIIIIIKFYVCEIILSKFYKCIYWMDRSKDVTEYQNMPGHKLS